MAKWRLNDEDAEILRVFFKEMGELQQQMQVLANQATYTAAKFMGFTSKPTDRLSLEPGGVYLVTEDEEDTVYVEEEDYEEEEQEAEEAAA